MSHEVTAPMLTHKQLEVLTFLADGDSMVEISRKLWVSDAAIRSRLKTIKRVLGTRSAVHSVAVAIRRNLIPEGATR